MGIFNMYNVQSPYYAYHVTLGSVCGVSPCYWKDENSGMSLSHSDHVAKCCSCFAKQCSA